MDLTLTSLQTRIQLQVNRISFNPPGLESVHQGFESKQVRNTGLEAIVDNLIEEIRTGGKDKDRKADTGLAELYSLDRKGDSKIIRSGILHHEGEFDSAMTVCVGFNQHKHLGRTQKLRPEVSIVIKAIREVQLQP